MPHRTRSSTGYLSSTTNLTNSKNHSTMQANGDFPLSDHIPLPKMNSEHILQHQMYQPAQYSSMSSSTDSFSRPSIISESSKSSTSSTDDSQFVRLARRRATKTIKERASQRKSTLSRPQGRPLSKETRVRLTLVPTMGILYSILVSDTMRKQLTVVKYSSDPASVPKTNEEMSTKNVISGFSSMLNVQSARFNDDPTVSPDKNSAVPQFRNIDDAVYSLFGLTEYSLIRVTRAAATEVGGSVLLKIETAMPGYLFLNDDEEDDFNEVEMNKDLYQETIGNLGDRPTTTFLKKRVARPRYKSDMRIYLIPRSTNCAIYCEKRIFKRDLMRGFLDFSKGDRSLIVGFDYADALRDLQNESHADLFNKFALPSVEQVDDIQKSIQETAHSEPGPTGAMYSGYHMATAPSHPSSSSSFSGGTQRSNLYGGSMRPAAESSSQPGGLSFYDHNAAYMSQPPQSYQLQMSQHQQVPFGYPNLVSGYPQQPGHFQPMSHTQPQQQNGPPQQHAPHEPHQQQAGLSLAPTMMNPQQSDVMYFNGPQLQQPQRAPSYSYMHNGAPSSQVGMTSSGSGQWVDHYGQPNGQQQQQGYYPQMDGYTLLMAPPPHGHFNGANGPI